MGAMLFGSVEKVPGVDEVDAAGSEGTIGIDIVLVDRTWVFVSAELVAAELLRAGKVVVVLGGHFGNVPSRVKVKVAVLKEDEVVMAT